MLKKVKHSLLLVVPVTVEGVSTNPDWPNLAGQGEGYLAKQLYDFRTDKRINAMMNGMA